MIRRINVARVFHAIRAAPGTSPQQLSKATRLDLATISIIVAGLERDGVVRREAGPRTGMSGRPTSALYVHGGTRALAGISFETDKIEILVTSLTGEVRGAVTLPGSLDPVRAADAAVQGLRGLLRRHRIARSALAGVGVGVPGLVGLDGTVVLAPNLDWHDIDLAQQLGAGIGAPVRVDNDTKAAATAEHLFGGKLQVADFAYLTGRSGIGGGLYLGGGLYRGPHGMAGELGHMKLVPRGRPCGCGGFGCFEAYVSEHAILTSLREHGREFADVEGVKRAAAAHDAVVVGVLTDAGNYLGLALANLANLLSPSRMVLGGSLATLAEFLLPASMPAYEANALAVVRRHVEITISELGERAVPLGGIALALEHFLENSTS
ncbi:MAG: sugar kinase [Acidocella sp. 20-61-6]|nr:MAG: sugar kinase [Acidocella sp. 20-61-6]